MLIFHGSLPSQILLPDVQQVLIPQKVRRHQRTGGKDAPFYRAKRERKLASQFQ